MTIEAPGLVLVTLGILFLCVALPTIGLTLAGVCLTALSVMVFSVAKGGIHETTAAILLVGAFICCGMAGISRRSSCPDSEQASLKVHQNS